MSFAPVPSRSAIGNVGIVVTTGCSERGAQTQGGRQNTKRGWLLSNDNIIIHEDAILPFILQFAKHDLFDGSELQNLLLTLRHSPLNVRCRVAQLRQYLALIRRKIRERFSDVGERFSQHLDILPQNLFER